MVSCCPPLVPSWVTMVTAVPSTCRCELMMSSVSMVTLASHSFCSASCGDASKTSASANEIVLKGIVHPKMKILSSFTNPQVIPNLYECLCSAEHKGRYFEECGKQSTSGAPLTSIVFFFYYGSQWCPKTAWLQTFFKISSFVFGRTKTFIQVWNYLRVSKWWQDFHFWVNYPFKCNSKQVTWNKRKTYRRPPRCRSLRARCACAWPAWTSVCRSSRSGCRCTAYSACEPRDAYKDWSTPWNSSHSREPYTDTASHLRQQTERWNRH